MGHNWREIHMQGEVTGRVGDFGVGTGKCEGANSNTSKMLELSLQGKWIRLARVWLEQNGPCTLQEYMIGVIPLMPTHIRLAGKQRATEAELAKAALRRFASQQANGLWMANEWKGSIYDYSNVHGLLNSDGHIVARLVQLPKKQKDALRQWLKANWETVSPGVYKPKDR
jgi:hypothetical protein